MKRVFIVAAERSGDELGAGLAEHIRAEQANISILGIGGDAMETAGVPSRMDISGLAILGFVEGLKHYPMILKKVRACVDDILETKPDAVILIDSWGFMIRVAKGLKARGYSGKIIKYVAPQVWAMRAGRAKILAKFVDLLLSIQPMDAAYFEPEGLETIYVGNPVFDKDYRSGDAERFRKAHRLNDAPIVSVWFGSRLSEIDKLAAVFCQAVSQLQKINTELKFIAPVSESVKVALQAHIDTANLQNVILQTPESEKLDVMKASMAAMACSGTVTTQLASACVPTIVAYKLNALTYWAAKRLFRPDYISIVNIAADAPLMPEYVQDAVTADNLANAMKRYLNDETFRTQSVEALRRQTDTMGASS